MDARSGDVECGTHGTQQATYVCKHIVQSVRDGVPRGFLTAHDPGNPHPDAWCADCEERVQATDGEWNDESEAFAGITLLCSACYRYARSLNEP